VKKAIIFGITGQDGSHLADLLLSKNYKVVGVVRRSSTDTTSRIRHLLERDNLEIVEGDITDSRSVMNVLIKNDDVDEIYNLAAQSHVGTSFKQAALTWDITGKGCMNILEGIVDAKLMHTRFYQASSSEMFGASYDVDCKTMLKYQNENTKFLPQSPYAISKCAAHYTVRLYREAYGLHASAGILFNHEGPRRGDNFVTKKITNWIVDFTTWLESNEFSSCEQITTSDEYIMSNDRSLSFPKLRLGNLDACRDWGYAGDYVRAMWLMMQQDEPDDYVICTGETHTIKDFLTLAFKFMNIDDWAKYVYIDPAFYRPAEVDFLRGDSSKARSKLGWEPKCNLEQLVSMMINAKINEKLQNHARSF